MALCKSYIIIIIITVILLIIIRWWEVVEIFGANMCR